LDEKHPEHNADWALNMQSELLRQCGFKKICIAHVDTNSQAITAAKKFVKQHAEYSNRWLFVVPLHGGSVISTTYTTSQITKPLIYLFFELFGRQELWVVWTK
jgi:hypothetical protein